MTVSDARHRRRSCCCRSDDELIVPSVPEAIAEQAAGSSREEGVMQLSVPLVAEAHWGKNWLEAKG